MHTHVRHAVTRKNPQLRQILTDFQNTLTDTLCGQFAIRYGVTVQVGLRWCISLSYCKLSAECASSRILKINQYLTSIWMDKAKVGSFFWDTLYVCSDYSDFKKIYILQRIVATQPKCGGIFYSYVFFRIFGRMCQWTNFENWSIFGEDVA